MPLPASWVDALFARLTVRYGAAFLGQYRDIAPDAVKADWAAVLAGFEAHADGIRYAMDNLPEAPLNALQFRALARRAPDPQALKLPEPKADAAVVAASRDALKVVTKGIAGANSGSLAQQCIDSIERVVKNRGGAISDAQRHMVAHCLRTPGTSTTLPVQRAGAMPQPEGTEA